MEVKHDGRLFESAVRMSVLCARVHLVYWHAFGVHDQPGPLKRC